MRTFIAIVLALSASTASALVVYDTPEPVRPRHADMACDLLLGNDINRYFYLAQMGTSKQRAAAGKHLAYLLTPAACKKAPMRTYTDAEYAAMEQDDKVKELEERIERLERK